MTTPKPIVADPATFYALGIRTLLDMLVLVHVGRCGTIGSRRASLAYHLGVNTETVRNSTVRLCDLGLLTSVCRQSGVGTPFNFICTPKGYEVLSTPADLSMFSHAQASLMDQ